MSAPLNKAKHLNLLIFENNDFFNCPGKPYPCYKKIFIHAVIYKFIQEKGDNFEDVLTRCIKKTIDSINEIRSFDDKKFAAFYPFSDSDEKSSILVIDHSHGFYPLFCHPHPHEDAFSLIPLLKEPTNLRPLQIA